MKAGGEKREHQHTPEVATQWSYSLEMADVATNFGGMRQAHLCIEVGTCDHIHQLQLPYLSDITACPTVQVDLSAVFVYYIAGFGYCILKHTVSARICHLSKPVICAYGSREIKGSKEQK
jgi:hypothetical protein